MLKILILGWWLGISQASAAWPPTNPLDWQFTQTQYEAGERYPSSSQGHMLSQGSVTANAFFGDGSHLTGLPGGTGISSVTSNTSQFSGDGSGLPSPLLLKSSSVTLQGNTFNAASSLLQLDTNALIPNGLVDSGSVTKRDASGFVPNGQLDSSSITKRNSSGFVPNAQVDPSSVAKLASTGFLPNYQLDPASITKLGPTLEDSEIPDTLTASNYVLKAGDGMSGPLTLNASTLTVGGNAFSVGASSFTVAGGSATVAYRMTATSFSGDGLNLSNVPPAGNAGGDLTGTYPSPTIGAAKVTDSKVLLSTGAVTSGKFGDGTVLISSNALNNPPVMRGGDSMTGQLTTTSTITVQGNAFSVGTSSFTIAGGSATVAYRMTAGSFVGVGASSTVIKIATETVTNSSTLQNDDHLAFQVAANETWIFDLYIVVFSTGATPNFKMAFTFPAGATMNAGYHASTATANGFFSGTLFGSGTASPSISVGASIDSVVFAHGTLVNGSTAGALQLQWAQQTANGQQTNVRINSHLRGTRVK